MLARPTEVPQTLAFQGGQEVSGSGFLKGIPEAHWKAAAVSEPGTWPPPEPVWAWLRPLVLWPFLYLGPLFVCPGLWSSQWAGLALPLLSPP